MSIIDYLNKRKTDNGFCLLALIDPDKKNDSRLDIMLSKINNSMRGEGFEAAANAISNLL